MISLKMKLAGAIIPLGNGAVGVTLVPADNGEGGAKATTMQVQILDADLAARVSLEDEFTISLEPAGELRSDAWQREQAAKNADMAKNMEAEAKAAAAAVPVDAAPDPDLANRPTPDSTDKKSKKS